MAKINQQLLVRLKKELKINNARVYQLIDAKVRATLLPRHLAAIAVAAESGVNISKYATHDELALIRQVPTMQAAVPAVVISPNQGGVKKTPKKYKKNSSVLTRRRGNSVFIVHGRNEKLRRSLYAFLRSVGLQPIEWHKAIELTGKPSPYVSEILDTAFREAVAIVVLLSPDDEAKLKTEFIKQSDPIHEKRLTGQARPNVLFEAGMAFGRNPDATVLVQIGEIRPFSDIGGRHVVNLSNATESRQELITKLANAGCNVDARGTDWHSEGDFSI